MPCIRQLLMRRSKSVELEDRAGSVPMRVDVVLTSWRSHDPRQALIYVDLLMRGVRRNATQSGAWLHGATKCELRAE
jgi:hypothetical protein